MTTAEAMAIREGVSADAPACAAIHDAWIGETAWMPRLHDAADIRHHYKTRVFAEARVLVAEPDGAVAGFLALRPDGCVTALYLAPAARGRGLGAALLDVAREASPAGLHLYAFQANEGARRFYAREGFVETARSDGDNEEGLPDLRLDWRPA